MFVKFTSEKGKSIWINSNNVFSIEDMSRPTQYQLDGMNRKTEVQGEWRGRTKIYSGGYGYDRLGSNFMVVEGSVHETLAKFNEGN